MTIERHVMLYSPQTRRERTMKRQRLVQQSWILVLVLIQFAGFAVAQPAGQERWVATWGAAMQQPAANASFSNQTVRMFVRSSIGGRRVRLQLSNTFGTAPIVLGPVHIALHGQGSAIVSGSDRALLFSGKPTVKIIPGSLVVSDAVNLDVPALADLAISVYTPDGTGQATRQSTALRTNYVAAGDVTGAAELPNATTTQVWAWISGVEVMAPANSGAIVVLGASSTAGTTSTPNTNRSWPSVLAERLQSNAATKNLSIINAGIAGNRVMGDTPTAGISALARFDRDVLGQAGIQWLMLFEGTNDVGGVARDPKSMTADDLIDAYKQMIERAHAHGIKVIGCTLNPFQGMAYYTEQSEAVRLAVNNWIMTSGAFDASIDFDAVTRDPANPKQLRPAFNNGDHLHPNDAGYKAMAEAIDLSIFSKK
jgi:lysophospholipase L1-like esterase